MTTLLADNPMLRWLLLAVVFGLFALIAAYVSGALLRRSATRSQLQQIGAQTPGTGASSGQHLRSREIEGAWAKMARAVEEAGLNLADTNSERLTAKLRSAGFTSPSAPRIFTLVRLVMIFVIPVGYVLLAFSSGEPPSRAPRPAGGRSGLEGVPRRTGPLVPGLGPGRAGCLRIEPDIR